MTNPHRIIRPASCLLPRGIRFEAGLGEHGVTVLVSPEGLDEQVLGLFVGEKRALETTPERVRVWASGRESCFPAQELRWVKDDTDFDDTPLSVWQWTMTPFLAFLLLRVLLDAPCWTHDEVPAALLDDDAWEGTLAGLCLPWSRFN